MADNPVGNISVRITGDFSDLQAKIVETIAEAQVGGQEIANAFAGVLASTESAAVGVNLLDESMVALASSVAAAQMSTSDLIGLFDLEMASASGAAASTESMAAALMACGMSAQQAATTLEAVGVSTQSLAPAMNAAGAASNAAATAVKQSAAAAEEATISLRGLYSQWILVGIAIGLVEKSVVTALESFGQIQRVGEALRATTGDVEAVASAMAGVPELADRIGVSIQSVNDGLVKFARYGLDLKQIPEILTAIQSGAIAEGKSFETVAAAWERAVNTGVLMSRSMQQMGINMGEVARAMGMVGRSSTEITAAFKGIQDGLDGTSAATLRAQILLAAMPEKLKGLATNVDDVTKSLTQAGNAWYEFKTRMGEALAEMGQGGGVTAFKVVLDSVATVILGLKTVFLELAKTIDAVVNVMIDAFVALGNAIADALTGNFKKAAADLQAGGQKMVKDWMTISGEMATEFTNTGKNLSEMWSGATASVSSSTSTMATSVGTSVTGMGAQVVQSAGMASAATLAFAADVNRAASSVVSNFQEIGASTNQMLKNAVAAFDLAAAAFFSGTGGATEYAKALKALDTVQKDLNGGLENQKTSMLLIANAYREMGVAVSNAHTTLAAVASDMANGMASATQYSVALKDLDKAQREFNGGLENAHTALLIAIDDYSRVGVTLANAQTTLAAVTEAYNRHKSTLGEVEAAINSLLKAEMAHNDGLASFSTLLKKTSVDFENIGNAAKNAQTNLLAVTEAVKQGRATLEQLSAATDDYFKKSTAAQGGVEGWANAELKLLDHHQKLEISLQNANDELAKATGLYHSGAIGIAEYNTYVEAAKRAHEALFGAHKQQAQAVSELSSALQGYIQAQNNATQSAQNAMSAGYQLQTEQIDLENALRRANTELERATELFNQGAIGSGVLERAIQAADSALKNLGSTTQGITGDMQAAVTALTNASQAMDKLGASASAAGRAIASVRGITGGSFSGAGSSLSGDAAVIGVPSGPGGGSIGSISMSMKPGDVWDFWKAMSSAQFGSMVTMGGPASMGNITNWSTTGTMGTPQELAALAAQQIQQTVATQQALMKALEELKNHSMNTAASVAQLGTAAASVTDKLSSTFDGAFKALQTATELYQSHLIDVTEYDKAVVAFRAAASALLGVVNAAAASSDQNVLDAIGLLAANPDLQAAFQNLNNELTIARNLYDSGAIGMATYQKTIDAATKAHEAWITATNGAATASQTLATASTSVAATLGSTATAIATVSNAILGISSVLEPLVLGKQQMLLAAQLPTGTGPNTAVSSVGGSALGSQVNLTINIPGTIVGPGGIDGVTTAIVEQLVNKLANKGIRNTRG